MIEIYLLSTGVISRNAKEALSAGINEAFTERVLSASSEALTEERIYAYSLLCYALADRLAGMNKVRLFADERGKPFIEGLKGAFSITHTDGLAAVAYSDCEGTALGIDAERISEEKRERVERLTARFLKDFRPSPTLAQSDIAVKVVSVDESGRLLCEGEASASLAQYSVQDSAFSAWTSAEALLKCEGGGFASLCSLGKIAADCDLFTSGLDLGGESFSLSLAIEKNE